MAERTEWNGEPCTAMRVTVTIADSGQFPAYWARHLVGTRRKAVRVHYGRDVFHLDDHDGSGWDKVTHGGSPRWAHRSLDIQPGTEEPRFEEQPDTSTPGMNEPSPPRLNRAARRAAARRKR
ncbi:hypothetical protein NLX86_06590 [Streptomyces sp. A3M-1-3]|uniref:hypothetical protein n=1 Tax=Streptomyces sp. A3M-1-3 TaxID=2962044 RepID=UPI0020B82888|nr:hypothetical protein [Streptomyces sp. A3M-1-3]MCP3817814.1 hypothetical protein [Streptomyces sp. A3M-1-3]